MFFVIPLHSLSRNAALRFLFSRFVLWKDLHIQRSSTRSVCRIFDVGRWVKETSYHFSWFWCFELGTSDEGSEQRQMECVASLVMVWVFPYLDDECLWLHFLYMIFYNGEFDPGSGWTLAIGLTHASRGETALCACTFWTSTGARVSIAYPTFPPLGDTPLKDGLIPDVVHIWHLTWTKDSSVEDGDASD